MSFGSRLKARRESLGITQPQLAEMLGVSKGAIGNYETDLNSPKATILYKVFDVLKCDANYLFQDEMKSFEYKDKATPEEFEKIIKKYRALNDHGREVVDFVLESEYQNSLKAAAVHESNIYMLNAAHERTDIEVTDEMRKHDDDIMDDENF